VAAPSPPVSAAPPPAAASYAPAAGAETAEGLPPAPRTVWPKLALTALVGSGANGTAVINGKVLSIGETIDGAELTAIGEGGVELEFGGDRQFLRIGGALP
jgi:hypothetical protein